jgi:hypothetical protein
MHGLKQSSVQESTMPKGSGYSGKQGESGKTPEMVGSKGGAHGYSSNYMGGVSSPNEQTWNGHQAPKGRDASIKKSGGDKDY